MCLAFGLLAVLTGLGPGCAPGEPELAGRPLSFWDSQLARQPGQRHPYTAEALASAPELALPTLQRRLLARDGPLRRLMLRIALAYPRMGLTVSSSDVARRGAADVLAANPGLGAAAAEPLTAALVLSKQGETIEAVQQALIRIKPPAIPHLLRLLNGRQAPAVPPRVLRTLTKILRERAGRGEYDEELASAAARHLESQDAEEVLAATEVLTRLGGPADAAMPRVLKNLRGHALPAVRAASATAVGVSAEDAMAGRAGGCIPALIAALTDPEDEVRVCTAIALGRFGGTAAESVRSLTGLAQETGTRGAVAAANALGRIGSPASPAVPSLIANLRRAEAIVRASSAGALGRILAEPGASVPALAALLKDDDAYVRQAAATALDAFGSEAGVAVPELIEALRDPVESVRISAAAALGSVGASAMGAAPALRAARNNNQSVMSRPVVEALARIQAGQNGRENR
jgi:HEAT repeat protein